MRIESRTDLRDPRNAENDRIRGDLNISVTDWHGCKLGFTRQPRDRVRIRLAMMARRQASLL